MRYEIKAINLTTLGQSLSVSADGYAVGVYDVTLDKIIKLLYLSKYSQENVGIVEQLLATDYTPTITGAGWIDTSYLHAYCQIDPYTDIDFAVNAFIATDQRYWKVFEMFDNGANDYADLENKPRINGVELNGYMTSADLKLSSDENVFTSLAGGQPIEKIVFNPNISIEKMTNYLSSLTYAETIQDVPSVCKLVGIDWYENSIAVYAMDFNALSVVVPNTSGYGIGVIDTAGDGFVLKQGVFATEYSEANATLINAIKDPNYTLDYTKAGWSDTNDYVLDTSTTHTIFGVRDNKVSAFIGRDNRFFDVVEMLDNKSASEVKPLLLTEGQTLDDKLVFNSNVSIEKMTEYLSKVNYDDNGMRLLMWVYGEGTDFSAQRTEIYAVDLATHGQVQGTELSGYVIFVLDMGEFTPKQVLFISEYTDNNLAFIQAMGVTNINYSADNYGWMDTSDLYLAEYKTYTNENDEVINLALTAGNFESGKICAFIGTDTRFWDTLSMFSLASAEGVSF